MSNARNLANLLNSSGDVKSDRLDNVPPSDDASALTTGTLPDGRFPATLPTVSGENLTGINTDLINDTTPQLGGNLDTQSFTVDGRDVSTDGTKLDGIEDGATADQAWGDVGGTLSNQTDLQSALDAKQATLGTDDVTATHIAANAVGADELNVTGNGTAGQYLGSDGDGTMTWTTISSDPSMGGDLSGTASNAQLVANCVTDTELNSSKLNGIAAGATNVTNNNQLTNGAGYITSATPPMTFNAIGTYTAGCDSLSNQSTHNGGTVTISGGSLKIIRPESSLSSQRAPFHAEGSSARSKYGSGCSGTWRNMAMYSNAYYSGYRHTSTLWIRIS